MNLFYSMIIILSIYLSISTTNLLLMWFIMELNLFSFMPFLLSKNNIKIGSNPMMNFFLIQCFSTMIFILSLFYFLLNLSFFLNYLIYILLSFSILIKLGFFPFHYWLIKLMKNISWLNCFIISTIQKIIPLFIMLNLWFNNIFILMLNMINSIFSTLGGMNNSNLKMILAYSSMNHLSWMFLILIISEKLFFLYISFYFLILYSIMMLFNKMNIYSIKNINNFKYSNLLKIIFSINFISLGGIPPLFGFILKWLTILIVEISYFIFMNLLILMIVSFLTFFYYIQIISTTMMFFNNYWNKMFLMTMKFNLNNSIFLMMFFSLWMFMINMIIL
uniref:NADH-ubiquinone oxidoreductase chain 2 n=1 Tax=Idris sp. MM-2013 TaxID=1429433 RepID=A0A067YFY6_9HYME|nr:NADH dehydrogenase subunit 2 [Idris sp. MM-2013]